METSLAPALATPARRYPSALIDRLMLADGTSVIVRPVIATDASAEQDFVRALSPASRQFRFHVGLHELAPDLLIALTDVDQRCHVAVVAEVLDAHDEPTLVGDARYVRLDCSDEAEFAITVGDAWQGLGLGSGLLRHMLRHAGRHGVRGVYGDILRTNAPMIALARGLGARFCRVPGDATITRAVFDVSGSALQNAEGSRGS